MLYVRADCHAHPYRLFAMKSPIERLRLLRSSKRPEAAEGTQSLIHVSTGLLCVRARDRWSLTGWCSSFLTKASSGWPVISSTIHPSTIMERSLYLVVPGGCQHLSARMNLRICGVGIRCSGELRETKREKHPSEKAAPRFFACSPSVHRNIVVVLANSLLFTGVCFSKSIERLLRLLVQGLERCARPARRSQQTKDVSLCKDFSICACRSNETSGRYMQPLCGGF